MVIDIEKVKNIVKFYADEAREIMPVDLVYLYGSYAKWTATEHSDVDVRFFLTSYDGDNWDNIMIKHFILS
ncbi:MAG: nucleotidyltransferase domain-containing protein, partial [Deltaproteobacteria bacterium]|nr:nucleotidyltransferase domain-containing protein [Deltaproteobacteria bacterium]